MIQTGMILPDFACLSSPQLLKNCLSVHFLFPSLFSINKSCSFFFFILFIDLFIYFILLVFFFGGGGSGGGG